MARRGEARSGAARQSKAGICLFIYTLGMAALGWDGQGRARLGKVRHGAARRGKDKWREQVILQPKLSAKG
jgi:hypothetical protein